MKLETTCYDMNVYVYTHCEVYRTVFREKSSANR